MTNRSTEQREPGFSEPLLGLWPQTAWVSALALGVTVLFSAMWGLPKPKAESAENQSCSAPLPFDSTPPQITPEAAHAMAERGAAAFVDCRSPSEYQEGHIAGAVHLPAEELRISAKARALLSAAPTVITYCDAACARSTKVAQHVIEAGFADVRILEGGMPAWLDAGYPAESGACPLCESH